MNNRSLNALAAAYLCIALGYGLVFYNDFSVHIRAALIFFFTVPVVATHISLLYVASVFWSKRYFLTISILWACKLIVLTLDEGLHYLAVGIPFLGWIDLFLLLGISVLVSTSFLFNVPFFYQKVSGKLVVLLGVGGLIMTAGLAVTLVLSIRDLLQLR